MSEAAVQIEPGQDGSLRREYINVYQEYSGRFRFPVAVLCEVGNQCQVFGYEDDTGRQYSNFRDVVRALNLAVSSPTTQALPRKLRAYGPMEALERYKQQLQAQGFGVVVMRETDQREPRTKAKVREVAEVITPGTSLSASGPSRLVALCVENVDGRSRRELPADPARLRLRIGMCALAMTTGELVVHQAESRADYEAYPLNEAYRFLRAMHATEVCVTYASFRAAQRDPVAKHVAQMLGLGRFFVREVAFAERLRRPDVALDVLRRAFPSLGGALRALVQQRRVATEATVAVLEAVYATRPQFMQSLGVPTLWEDSQCLVLAHNAAEQLELVGKRGLLGILDRTATPMGRRLLSDWVLMPLVDAAAIRARHAALRVFAAEMTATEQAALREQMRECAGADLPLLVRKANVRNPHAALRPTGLGQLCRGVRRMLDVFRMLEPRRAKLEEWFPEDSQLRECEEFVARVEGAMQPGALKRVEHITANPGDNSREVFRRGANARVDEAMEAAESSLGLGDQVLGRLVALLYPRSDDKPLITRCENSQREYFRLARKNEAALLRHYKRLADAGRARIRRWSGPGEFATFGKGAAEADDDNSDEEADRRAFSRHVGRFARAPRTLSEADVRFLRDMRVSNGKSGVLHVQLPEVDEAFDRRREDAEQACRVVIEEFNAFVGQLYERWHAPVIEVAGCLAAIDVLRSGAEVALRNNYHEPVVVDNGGASYVRAQQLRHPIAELLLEDVRYVPNDLALGPSGPDDETPSGLLLFGVNNSGKSCFTKSAALAVIMAQAGLWVPAARFELRPYRNLVTRLCGSDNLYNGQGTFAVEASELNTILRTGDCNTLALGDEIAHGTAYFDAVSLVAAAIVDLVATKANFVFATHFHRVIELPEVEQLAPRVTFRHFSVQTLPCGELVYDRVMQPGAGPSVYGVEIAQAHGLPERVIQHALRIRRGLLGEPLQLTSTERGRYNTRVIATGCQVPGCVRKGVDSHHIRPQHAADDRGMIDGAFHKNRAFNQVKLCKKHHDLVTYGKMWISGWDTTLNGERVLRYGAIGGGPRDKPDEPASEPDEPVAKHDEEPGSESKPPRRRKRRAASTKPAEPNKRAQRRPVHQAKLTEMMWGKF